MPDPGPLEAALVVVNYGSSELLRHNLVPIGRAVPELVVVVVDNFSSSPEQAAVAALAAAEGWDAVLNEANEGFGTGVNAGVERARSLGRSRFVVLNPDATLPPDGLVQLLAAVAGDPMLMVSPQVEQPDGRHWFAGSDLYLADGRIRSRRRRPTGVREDEVFGWLSGACLAFSAELWQRVGGFDDRYFLYWEDVDLSWRVVQTGGRLRVADEVVAVHEAGGTQSVVHGDRHRGKSAGYYYFNTRNRLLFAGLHLGAEGLARWRRHDLAVAWEIVLQGGRRQLLYTRRPLVAAARGLRDGRRLSRQAVRSADPDHM